MSLFALLVLLAQDGLPPAGEPSAMACTFEVALRGRPCVYEGSAGAADPRDNSASASEAGAAECARAASQPEKRKRCEREVADASLSAACALRTRLSDPAGKLTPEAAGCVGALRAILSRALFDGASSP